MVCDAHLAQGIRVADLPILISTDSSTGISSAKHQVSEIVEEKDTVANKFDVIKARPGVYIKKDLQEEQTKKILNVQCTKCGHDLKRRDQINTSNNRASNHRTRK